MDEERDETLPPGWAWARLNDVCDVIGGVTVDAGRRGADLAEIPYLRVKNVQRGHIDLAQVKSIAVAPSTVERLALRKGDILLNEGGDRDKVGRGWVWEAKIATCIFQNHVFRARPRSEEVNPYYISHFLNDKARAHFLSTAKQTTNLASLSLTNAKATLVALPPAEEQFRIALALAELLEAVDEAEAAVERARDRAAVYRASLLHAACTGALTADWRAANPNPKEDGPALLHRILAERRAAWERAEAARLKERGRLKADDRWKAAYVQPSCSLPDELPSLPESWTWACLDQLSTDSSYGTSIKCTPIAGGVPVLRIPNVQSGRLDYSNLKFSTGNLALNDCEFLAPGDLLIVRTNGSQGLIGRAACVEQPTPNPSYFASYLIRFRLTPIELIARWITTALDAPVVRSQILKFAATSAGQYNVSQSNLRGLCVPLPPPDELEEILRKIGDDEDEANQPTNIDFADLRESILHAAFTGQLVPQDPTDEPASALLARLRADTAAAPGVRTRRPRQKATA